jgi:hypothetical protein
VGWFKGLSLGWGFESGLPDAEDAKVTQRTQKKTEKNTKNSKNDVALFYDR